MFRVRLVLLVVALVALAGCGGEATPRNDAFEGEVRGAMASIGNYVESNELLKEARTLKREAGVALTLGEDRHARNLLLLMEADIDQANERLDAVDFKRYSKKANEAAQRRVEGRGLVAEGCEEVSREWRC